MSLLGIDVGTTGCKALVFAEDDGRVYAAAYREYDIQRPQPGWAELDAREVWDKVQQVIREVVAQAKTDPVRALSVSSMGEATVPVSADRRILGPSILMDDARGAEYLEGLGAALAPERLYALNGNTLGNHYSVTKLLWMREHRPEVFESAHKFLLWSGFVSFMLGAEPAVDYSLANRTLLFDLHREKWSEEILDRVGLNPAKLPEPVPSGRVVGAVLPHVADDLGLPRDTLIVTGAHDQCANALDCGATGEGQAMLGLGTYLCLVPTYATPPPAAIMMDRGLCTEHHSVPGLFVSFIFNQGGCLLKWYRNTFAQAEHATAIQNNEDVYERLLSEMPADPSKVVALPHFMPTGAPHFITDSCGVMAGLRLETPRGEIAKALIEGAVYYLRECVETLPGTGIAIDSVRVVGGGSRSDAWVQICADILGRPCVRPEQTEAGALGAAIMAGTGVGIYGSMREGAETLVRLQRSFEPDPRRQAIYDRRFEFYRRLWPLMKDYLRDLSLSS